MILRSAQIEAIQAALSRSRIVTLIGPRQCGKSTLARFFLSEGYLRGFRSIGTFTGNLPTPAGELFGYSGQSSEIAVMRP